MSVALLVVCCCCFAIAAGCCCTAGGGTHGFERHAMCMSDLCLALLLCLPVAGLHIKHSPSLCTPALWRLRLCCCLLVAGVRRKSCRPGRFAICDADAHQMSSRSCMRMKLIWSQPLKQAAQKSYQDGCTRKGLESQGQG